MFTVLFSLCLSVLSTVYSFAQRSKLFCTACKLKCFTLSLLSLPVIFHRVNINDTHTQHATLTATDTYLASIIHRHCCFASQVTLLLVWKVHFRFTPNCSLHPVSRISQIPFPTNKLLSQSRTVDIIVERVHSATTNRQVSRRHLSTNGFLRAIEITSSSALNLSHFDGLRVQNKSRAHRCTFSCQAVH